MKILNLYAGIGGNRKLWGDKQQVTAVEYNPDIAAAYADHYPNDELIIGDAHQYLLDHYKEFDFIWSSPPCPTHGQYRFNVGHKAKGYPAVYPDMQLYEEILFLQHYYGGKWVVENVKPYYKPLVEPTVTLQRHLLWSNFDIPHIAIPPKQIRSKNKLSDFDTDLSKYKLPNKRQVLRNCVEPELGLHILMQLTPQLNPNKDTSDV